MLLLWMACGRSVEPAAPSAPPPQVDATPASTPVTIDLSKPLRPDGRELVAASAHTTLPWDVFRDLDPGQQQVALSVINAAPGSCPACLEQGTSLADCALQPPAGCENTAGLAQRCVRLAGQGLPASDIYDLCAFHEPWIDLDLSGLEGRGAGTLPVVIAVDDRNPASTAYDDTMQQLREAYPTQITLYVLDVQVHVEQAQAWGVRSTPTVFVDGYRLRGSRSLDNLRFMVDAQLLDRESP